MVVRLQHVEFSVLATAAHITAHTRKGGKPSNSLELSLEVRHPQCSKQLYLQQLTVGGGSRNRTDDEAFAEPCLTTWLPRRERAHKLNSFCHPRKFNRGSTCKPQLASLLPKLFRFENSNGRDDAGDEFRWRHIKTGIACAARRICHTDVSSLRF